MDPICVETEEVAYTRSEVEKIIKYNPVIKSMQVYQLKKDIIVMLNICLQL